MATLFLAFPVPDSVADALPAVWAHYGSVIETPTPRPKLHLTLLWLGSADEVTADHRQKLAEPLPQSFVPTLRLTHIGRGRKQENLWAYAEAAGPIVTMRDHFIQRLSALGWTVPTQELGRDFTPHITVATLHDQVSHVGVADYPFITSYTVSEVLLYKSTPVAQQPAVYSILERIPLT